MQARHPCRTDINKTFYELRSSIITKSHFCWEGNIAVARIELLLNVCPIRLLFTIRKMEEKIMIVWCKHDTGSTVLFGQFGWQLLQLLICPSLPHQLKVPGGATFYVTLWSVCWSTKWFPWWSLKHSSVMYGSAMINHLPCCLLRAVTFIMICRSNYWPLPLGLTCLPSYHQWSKRHIPSSGLNFNLIPFSVYIVLRFPQTGSCEKTGKCAGMNLTIRPNSIPPSVYPEPYFTDNHPISCGWIHPNDDKHD